jgi:pilus assembly protein Flp/PilA
LRPYCPGVERATRASRGGRIEADHFEVSRRRIRATAIEYGLIAAGISLAIITAVNGIGGSLSTKFGDINTSLK